jgi:hypothetical protein
MLPRGDVRASAGLHARIAVVQISMTMPVMEPDLDAALLRDWARATDDGPFASLCWGERMAFDNPETLTLMGALAAWTDRVRLVTTVIVPQLHDPVMLAKALATGDMPPREAPWPQPPTPLSPSSPLLLASVPACSSSLRGLSGMRPPPGAASSRPLSSCREWCDAGLIRAELIPESDDGRVPVR